MFDPDIAQMRFGYGRSPLVAGPADVAEMLGLLRGPDVIGQRFPIPKDPEMRLKVLALRDSRRAFTKAEAGSEERNTLHKRFKLARQSAKEEVASWIGTDLARRVWTKDGLRERLVAFWADHFSAPAKSIFSRYSAPSYVESAIRPHIAGRFEDLLIAAVLHPQMQDFLDQRISVGPESPFAKRNPQKALGLNENLAREILELHTLGVDAAYTQADVRQLAELLTGVTSSLVKGTIYVSKRAEPGSETILGKEYGTRRARIEDVHEALRDLARHPDTARHIARKLAVHFVSDVPDEDLLVSLAARYLETDGDLFEVMDEMLHHPAAWEKTADGAGNFKQPEVFVCSALRALAVPEARLTGLKSRQLQRFVGGPLRHMGQPWRAPFGPDGFEETDSHWLSPQGLAARLQWSLGVPAAAVEALPDPRVFVQTALGDTAPAAVRFAAEAAENRREGIALVLMSPAFQRA